MAEERTVSVSEINASTPRFIKEAEAGEVITIARQGRPVAQLIPYGLPMDDLETFQALADVAEQAFARVRDFPRRHTTTPQEEQ